MYETEPCIVFKRKGQLWGIEAKAQHWMVQLLILLRWRRLGRGTRWGSGAREAKSSRCVGSALPRRVVGEWIVHSLSATDVIKKKEREGVSIVPCDLVLDSVAV